MENYAKQNPRKTETDCIEFDDFAKAGLRINGTNPAIRVEGSSRPLSLALNLGREGDHIFFLEQYATSKPGIKTT